MLRNRRRPISQMPRIKPIRTKRLLRQQRIRKQKKRIRLKLRRTATIRRKIPPKSRRKKPLPKLRKTTAAISNRLLRLQRRRQVQKLLRRKLLPRLLKKRQVQRLLNRRHHVTIPGYGKHIPYTMTLNMELIRSQWSLSGTNRCTLMM